METPQIEPLLPCCLASAAPRGEFTLPLPGLDDEEGPTLPEALPPVVDAHVHLFPERMFEAIWRWFDAFGWPIRYKLQAPEVTAFLLSRGVSRVVALQYAHRPGIARRLNQFMAALVAAEPRIIGMAAVYPGEPDAADVLREAFDAGLSGVKLHCHVQCLSADDERMVPIFEACARAGKPVILHAGREPTSPGYPCDPHALCSADRVRRVLLDHPTMKLVVPHLGADELDEYEELVTKHDNLWLDTTMAIAEYMPIKVPPRMLAARPERILYGTDFPNIPYAWDREIKKLLGMGLREEQVASILGGTAASLHGFAS